MSAEAPVAVITGGASGIGLETARVLARGGHRLVLSDVEAARLHESATGLRAATEVLEVVTDVSDKAAVDALAERAFAEYGRADVVFLNAGVALAGPTAQMGHDDWTWVLGVNLWGAIHGVEAFLPRMIEAGAGGHLLFTASFAGLVANARLGAYTVSKYGVVGLAEVLHRELRPHDIGVSVLCPMRVHTDIGDSERNRPSPAPSAPAPAPDTYEPASEPTSGTGSETGSETGSDLAGRILPADVVAERLAAAIGTRRLYVLPHEESRDMIRRRFDRIDRAFDEDGGSLVR